MHGIGALFRLLIEESKKYQEEHATFYNENIWARKYKTNNQNEKKYIIMIVLSSIVWISVPKRVTY